MGSRLQLSAATLLAGTMLLFGPSKGLNAATSPAPDILSDDRTPDAVEVGKLKPLARPRPEPAKALPSGNPLWSVSLSALAATQARPIFSASRRPPQAAVIAPAAEQVIAPPPAAAEEGPSLALIGAVVGDGEAIAVLLDRASQKIIRLRPGDSHGGWQLSGVEGREVTLKKDSRSETLVLRRQEGPTGAAPAANGGEPGMPTIPVAGGQGTSFAPFVPRHTPKNGEADGL